MIFNFIQLINTYLGVLLPGTVILTDPVGFAIYLCVWGIAASYLASLAKENWHGPFVGWWLMLWMLPVLTLPFWLLLHGWSFTRRAREGD